MSRLNIIKNNTQKGFTLIEMMVAVSVFAIVVMISMTAILSVVDSSKKAQSLKSVMNNLNFALETMTRSIKTGTELNIARDGKEVSTKDQNDVTLSYFLGETATTSIVRTSGGTTETITAPEVVINNLKFVDGTAEGQPSVVVIIKGTVKLNERVSSEFNIQTTVTQRSPAL